MVEISNIENYIKVLYITNGGQQIKHVQEAQQWFKGKQSHIDLDVYRMTSGSQWTDAWKKRLSACDAVIVTNTGSGLDTPFLRKLWSYASEHHDHYIFYAEEPRIGSKLTKGFTETQKNKIDEFRRTSGLENYVRLFQYVAYALHKTTYEPEIYTIPWTGIIGASGHVYATYDSYMEEEGNKDWPSVGVFFYREEWIAKGLAYQNALRDALVRLELNPILFFGQYGAQPQYGIPSFDETLEQLFGTQSMPLSCIINTCKFSLVNLKGIEVNRLRSYNVPIIQGYTIYMDETSWMDSPFGLSPSDVSMSVALPEFDGAIHGGLVATQRAQEDGTYTFVPCEERVHSIARKAKRWATLKQKNLKDLKVAIILHNYPPTNSNIGTAAGLDTPASLMRLLESMKASGYKVDWIPLDTQGLMRRIIDEGTNDWSYTNNSAFESQGTWIEKEIYAEQHEQLHHMVQEQLRGHWGNPPGDVLVHEEEICIPGFQNGNLWITVQPPRGFSDRPGQLYHDPLMPPPHQYIAFYRWLRDVFKADAVIHFGTHGSLEWLPGKGTGLSETCYPELILDELPNIYPYWTTIVGEGLQAKRRSSACLIGHLSPPLDESGLYESYETLEQLLEERTSYKQGQENALQEIDKRILEISKECHLWESVEEELNEQEDFEEACGILHALLTDLKHSQMRTGLHILGKNLDGNDMSNMLLRIVQHGSSALVSNGLANYGNAMQHGDAVTECRGLPYILANMMGYEWEELLGSLRGTRGGANKAKGINEVNEVNKVNEVNEVNEVNTYSKISKFKISKLVDQVWEAMHDFIAHLEAHNFLYNETLFGLGWQSERAVKDKIFSFRRGDSIATRSVIFHNEYLETQACQYALDCGGCTKQLKSRTYTLWRELDTLVRLICQNYIPLLERTEDEIKNMLSALQGNYIEPGPGGAISSGRVEALPTGRNFYGADERTMPTQTAMTIGGKLAQGVIDQYIATEHRYPESVGMVMWAGTNLRSFGQCIGQYFQFLGVRPLWNSMGRIERLEIIPLEELKRPRIDVTVRISGLMRDVMPWGIRWLDEAAQIVAGLEESVEDNFIRKHVLADVKWLVEEGVESELAYEQAKLRIFGDPPGAYGAGIGALIESQEWESKEDVANVYMTWSQYAYSKEGVSQHEGLFHRRLSTVEVTIKNEDQRECQILSAGDYNDYHGGMIAAVETIRGIKPKSFVGDTSNHGSIRVHSLKEELRHVLRSETLNPKYIEGMMKHGYKGASDLSNVLHHSFSWDVTSGIMDDWMYESYAQKYALDKEVQDWMKEVNPWALLRVVETLLEAIERGLWNASSEMEEELQNMLLQVEGDLEEHS